MPRETKALIEQRHDDLRQQLAKSLNEYIAVRNPDRYRNMSSMIASGAKLREEAWKFPLLNGAANAYQDLAATREWTVSGKETVVSKVVEAINNVRTWDYKTGMWYKGMEQHLRRRAEDYLFIGRNAWLMRGTASNFEFMYLDPAVLYYKQELIKMNKYGYYDPVPEDKMIWGYGASANTKAVYRYNEVQLNHAIPVGIDGFIAPAMLAYPMAQIAWLIDEHDRAQVDGRKLRDILLVDKGILEPILIAIQSSLKLWSGDDPTKVGVPIVEISQAINGPLQDRIAHLGLSTIPENFDRQEFDHRYANQIASAFGLALRQFWQDDSNTNRALEEVQEARQQLKGPLAFVRGEQRLINSSPIVRIFGQKPTYFAFVEEADTSSLKDRADALLKFAQALLAASQAIGAKLKPQPLLQKAQEYNLLPSDIPIEDMLMTAEEILEMQELQQAQVEQTNEVKESPDQRTNAEDEVTQLKIAKHAFAWLKKEARKAELDIDEVKMTSQGQIIDRRRPMFPVDKILKKALESESLLDRDAISRYDDESDYEDGSNSSLFLEGVLNE